MDIQSRKNHWEQIYKTREPGDLGWFQQVPVTSLQLLRELGVPKMAKIIDIGGGDSLFVDHLLALGYRNITVLDISGAAIERARKRLGAKAEEVTWVVSDVTKVSLPSCYDLWHDRATFHFLRDESEILQYLETAREHVTPGGHLVMGTFSDKGPKTCSGLPVKNYSEAGLASTLGDSFQKIRCLRTDHITPSGTIQNYVYCSFKRQSDA